MNQPLYMYALYTLADYPVLAELAAKRTQASRLDGRACRAIYDSALSGIDWQAVSEHEREFMRQLGANSDAGRMVGMGDQNKDAKAALDTANRM